MPNSRVAKFTGWSILIVAFVAGAIGIYSYANYARFHRRVAAIQAAGDPVSSAELDHKVENEEDDMLFHLLPLKESLLAFAQEIPQYDSLTIHKLTDDEAIKKFEEGVKVHPELFDTLTRVSHLQEISFDPNYGLTEFQILEWQKVMLVLDWKARIQNNMGSHDDAAETCFEMLRFANVVERPTLLNYLLGQAFRLMAYQNLRESVLSSKLDPNLTKRINEALDSIDPTDAYRATIKMERAFMIEGLVNREADEADATPIELPEFRDSQSGLSWVAFKLPGGAASFFGNDILDQFAEIIERSETPLSTQFAPSTERPIRLLALAGGKFVDSYDQFRNSAGRSLAFARALRIQIALTNSDIAIGKTDWSQDELVALGVPQKATVDPFTGKPMIVKQTEAGWFIYSLGPNQTDEGNPAGFEDYGFGPPVKSAEESDTE